MLHQKITTLSNWFLSRSRSVKRLITVAVDFVAIVLSLWLAFSLRYGEFYLPSEQQVWIFFLAPVVAIPLFIRAGLYRAIVRHLGMQALWAVVKVTSFYALIFAVIVLLAGVEQVPRTVYGINALILMLFVGSSRLIARWWFTNSISSHEEQTVKRRIPPIIIYGAGASGAQMVAALKMSRQLRPVAFIDDDASLHRQQINGLTVYSFSELAHVIEKFYVNDVLLAMPSIPRGQRNKLISLLEPYPVHVRTLPSLMDLAEGKVSISDIQEVDIADLLGREAVEPIQTLLHANITDKAVIVTGAGGSIGSELCRQILKLKPTRLVLYELNEFGLYAIEKELDSLGMDISIIPVLGSVVNQSRVEAICRRFEINTIYHAAAYKHVPMVEKNTTEGVRNNVFGTLSCAKAAIASNVETFVLISTDKAVRPTNTMGATKRFAELVLQGLAGDKTANPCTRFTMVRFGNVLGSSGSVVPLFREQIAKGGPVTVTDSRIIRYFMTIPEAAELVIQAGAMGQGGDVFVLDMGEPIRIVDLAKRMIHLSGFVEKDEQQPEGDIEISYTGLRPGEKLYEELLIGDNVSDTEHQKIMRAEEKVISWMDLSTILQQLEGANELGDSQKVRNILMTHVDGFKPQCDVEDWLK
ncbi:MAG: nucleoside-diphosphate sugar epimerase/dehydratase [Gammaproteobacteria bacterium]|nr:nucleoside-diphosphate sugar epimerase/dehydratase [Gammaproteobacteria bacterium]